MLLAVCFVGVCLTNGAEMPIWLTRALHVDALAVPVDALSLRGSALNGMLISFCESVNEHFRITKRGGMRGDCEDNIRLLVSITS